jgi:hypothetical protein
LRNLRARSCECIDRKQLDNDEKAGKQRKEYNYPERPEFFPLRRTILLLLLVDLGRLQAHPLNRVPVGGRPVEVSEPDLKADSTGEAGSADG